MLPRPEGVRRDGWADDDARQQVALEPGMLRAVLPWILGPWAVFAWMLWR